MSSHFSKCVQIYAILPEINSSGGILISKANLGISAQAKISQCSSVAYERMLLLVPETGL